MTDVKKIEIEIIEVDLDPPVTVFGVEVQYDDDSIWRETFATKPELRAFGRGLRAMSTQAGFKWTEALMRTRETKCELEI